MFGVTIMDRDQNGVLTVDLRDILRLIGPEAETAQWQVSDIEALDGEAARELDDVADRQLRFLEMYLYARLNRLIKSSTDVFELIEIRRVNLGPSYAPLTVHRSMCRRTILELVEQIRRQFKNVAALPDG